MSFDMIDMDAVVRVALAALLSLPIGLEREWRGKPAGLRTHIVVASACAALGYLSVATADGFTNADRTRIASQVVSGIGFIGAGVIFASKGRVRGLTTAAALFGAAALGLAAGMDQPWLAVALVVITLVTLSPLDWVAGALLERRAVAAHTIQFLAQDADALVVAQQTVAGAAGAVRRIDLDTVGDQIGVAAVVRCRPGTAEQIVAALADLPGVRPLATEAGDPLER